MTDVEIMPIDGRELPAAEENNVWYHYRDTDSVFVFVHGIMSCSRDCWKASKPSVYWPELVVRDHRLDRFSVYLGGYITALDSGEYDVWDCANELLDGIRTHGPNGERSVLEHRRIVFVCHSLGGIVVRHLIEREARVFEGRSIGLVLIASPTRGSQWASLLSLLASFYRNRLALTLRRNEEFLEDLHRRFQNAKEAARDSLAGIEAYEQFFPLHTRIVPQYVPPIVTKGELGGYWSAPEHLGRTDHFSCVKPKKLSDPAHRLLTRFLKETFDKRFPPDRADPKDELSVEPRLQFVRLEPGFIGPDSVSDPLWDPRRGLPPDLGAESVPVGQLAEGNADIAGELARVRQILPDYRWRGVGNYLVKPPRLALASVLVDANLIIENRSSISRVARLVPLETQPLGQSSPYLAWRAQIASPRWMPKTNFDATPLYDISVDRKEELDLELRPNSETRAPIKLAVYLDPDIGTLASWVDTIIARLTVGRLFAEWAQERIDGIEIRIAVGSARPVRHALRIEAINQVAFAMETVDVRQLDADLRTIDTEVVRPRLAHIVAKARRAITGDS